MSYEPTGPGGVTKSYGARELGGAAGILKTEGFKNELAVHFNEANVKSGQLIADAVIRGGGVVKTASLFVTEPFAGTFTLSLGEKGDEATNGISLEGLELNVEGYADVSSKLVGDWVVDAGIPEDTLVGLELSAGEVTGYGRAKLVIEYLHVA